MAEIILTATDTVFHEIDLKVKEDAAERTPVHSGTGSRERSSKTRSSKSRSSISRDNHIDREVTEDYLKQFREESVIPESGINMDSDAEWDTDLEDEGYPSRFRYSRNEDPKYVYLGACRQLNIVPASRFMKGIDTRTMNLNYQGLGPVGVRAVATGLVVDRRTTCLSLAGNFIGRDGIRCLCEMLRENDIIHDVDLSENDIDTVGVRILSEMFRINDTITKLSLSGNRLKGSDAMYIADVLTLPLVFRNDNLHGLRSLDLSHNELGDDGAQIIGHAIADNEVLTELNISWNQIRKAGIMCLAKGIKENNCLRKMDISTNGISNEGAEAIGKALEHNRTLEELVLNSNRIGLEGVTVLFKSIAKNEKLRTIRLSNNPMSYQGPTAALQLLQKSDISVLEEIEMADACVPPDFLRLLEELQENKPQFRVLIGGFMDSKDMCKAEIKSNKESWNKDPVLVFVNFIEQQNLRVVDIFKAFDTDRSLMVSADEFRIGVRRVGCPLSDKQLDHVVKTLDTDRNGEIDLEEFFQGHIKHKRRLERLLNYGSRSVSRISSPKPDMSEHWSRPSSRSSFEDNTGRFLDSRQSMTDKITTHYTTDYTTESERDSMTPGGMNFDDTFLEPPRPITMPKVMGHTNKDPLQNIIIPVPTTVSVS